MKKQLIVITTYVLLLTMYLIPAANAEENKGASKPQTALKEYFSDDFDGEGLTKEWEVINPNDEQLIVEDGSLLMLSTKPGAIKGENIENLLRLSKPLPKGDWTITVKFTIEYQTWKEHLRIGLYDDKDNWIIAENYIAGYYDRIVCRARKSAKGEERSFEGNIAYIKTNYDRKFLDNHSRPQYLSLRKQGRNYIVSGKFGDQENWVELEKLTALRAKGNLIIGFSMYEKVAGESFVNIDWIKIEVPKSWSKIKVPKKSSDN